MENAIQLRITTDMDALPAAIEFNYAELKGALESYLARFDGLVVTEDQIRQATVDRAEINRVAKTIARARIDTKKRYLEPFELFEARAKELEGLCKQVEGKIAEQLEEFERERMEKKRFRLGTMWLNKVREAFGGDGQGEHHLAFFEEKINPRTKGCWLNKGATEDVVVAEMDAEIRRCKELLAMVEGMYAEADEETKAKAKLEAERTMDLQRTVQAVNAFKAEREALAAARRAKEERERAEAEAKAATPAPAPQAQPQPAPAPAPVPAPAGDSDEDDDEDVVIAPQPAKRITITLRVTGTKEQFNQLREAMDRIGIAGERI